MSSGLPHSGAPRERELRRNRSVRLVRYDSADHDKPLEAWLRAPHVTEWWGRRTVGEVVDDGSDGENWIIEAAGCPAGFIRWHRLSRSELNDAGLIAIPDGGIDLDVLVGLPELLGQGIGTEALRQMVEMLEQGSSVVAFFGLCTEPSNSRAIACYRKAGFTVETPFSEGGKSYVFLQRASQLRG